ncbi:MAG: hypothetical protein MZV70_29255 [Desulfobacterales bacterium]|nr:hypothetical protein [Desulfobacterales bacterium]
MAKASIIIEDAPDGDGVDISLVIDPPLTEDTKDLTDAHRMAYVVMQMLDSAENAATAN